MYKIHTITQRYNVCKNTKVTILFVENPDLIYMRNYAFRPTWQLHLHNANYAWQVGTQNYLMNYIQSFLITELLTFRIQPTFQCYRQSFCLACLLASGFLVYFLTFCLTWWPDAGFWLVGMLTGWLIKACCLFNWLWLVGWLRLIIWQAVAGWDASWQAGMPLCKYRDNLTSFLIMSIVSKLMAKYLI